LLLPFPKARMLLLLLLLDTLCCCHQRHWQWI
jgi:hypothetical protein